MSGGIRIHESVEGQEVRRLQQVNPETIIIDQHQNGRKFEITEESIDRMGWSILREGQQQAAITNRLKDRRLQMAVGYRRGLAVQKINKYPEKFQPQDGEVFKDGFIPGKGTLLLDVIVRDLTPLQVLIANVLENRERESCSAIDDAHNIQRLFDEHRATKEEVRKLYSDPRTGKPASQGWIDQRVKLLRLPEEAQLAIHLGQLPASHGHKLADIPVEEAMAIVQEAKTDKGLDTSKVAERVRTAKVTHGQKGERTLVSVKKVLKEIPTPLAEMLLKFISGEVDETAVTEAFLRTAGMIGETDDLPKGKG